MKIITVCGLGMGTSLILRMNVETVLKNMQIQASVEHMDVSAAASTQADLIVTSNEFANNLAGLNCPIAIVNNYIDLDEIKKSLIDINIEELTNK